MPMLKLRLIRPSYLVDINRVPNLSYISIEGDKIRIAHWSGTTRWRLTATSGRYTQHYPRPQYKSVIRKLGTWEQWPGHWRMRPSGGLASNINSA